MTTVNSIKNRVDALSPDEGPIPTDPKKMTDRQLLTAIVRQRYNRAPYPDELTPEGSDRLIKQLMKERDELPDR